MGNTPESLEKERLQMSEQDFYIAFCHLCHVKILSSFTPNWIRGFFKSLYIFVYS
jgi:hypothetical protein